MQVAAGCRASSHQPAKSAQAAPSPGPAAAATTPASTAPAATPTAATAPSAASASTATADPGHLQAASALLLVEQMEGGEADVGHLLVVKNEAVLGPVVGVGLRDSSRGHCRCGCASRQRKPKSGGTQCRHGDSFGRAVGRAVLFCRSLHPCHVSFPSDTLSGSG